MRVDAEAAPADRRTKPGRWRSPFSRIVRLGVSLMPLRPIYLGKMLGPAPSQTTERTPAH